MARADNNIKGKLAFITDASGSIGAATARSLLKQDVDLALHYTHDMLAIEDLVAQLRHDYETHVHPAEDRFLRITTHQADLGSVEGCVGLLEDVRKAQGRAADILVFIAESSHGNRPSQSDAGADDSSVAAFEAAVHSKLRSAFVLTEGILAAMKSKRWGRLVYVSNGGGRSGGAATHDAMIRGGLIGLMGDVSATMAGYGVTSNGVVAENIVDLLPDQADAGTKQDVGVPLGRAGTPSEVANVVVMFATTGYITGQTVPVIGGPTSSSFR